MILQLRKYYNYLELTVKLANFRVLAQFNRMKKIVIGKIQLKPLLNIQFLLLEVV